jgi:hypothetical protein
MFAREYARLKDENISAEDAQALFLAALHKSEAELLDNIATRDHANGGVENLPGALSREEKQRALAEASGHNTSFMLKLKARTFMCCVDGSDEADSAFKTTLHLRKKYDNVCVFHAFSKEKSALLASTYQPDQIKQRYESQLISACKRPYFSMHFEERYNRSALRVLQDLISLYSSAFSRDILPTLNRPDFIVVGYCGRKGPKDKPRVLGSTADLALRTLPVPVIVAKRPISATGSRHFVFAANFTEASKKGLDILLTLVSPRDTLRVIFVRHASDSTEEIADSLYYYYSNELTENGPVDSAFQIMDVPDERSVAETVVEFVNGPHMPDFLAIAPRPHVNGLSTSTEYIVENSAVSVILCRN